MNRSSTGPAPDRSLEDLIDAQDLRSVIVAALAARPVYEQSLRRGVWTYVRAEQSAGVSPGHVILALTELVDAANITPVSVRRALTHRVLLWCVEAYFGHLGGEDMRVDVIRDSALTEYR